MGCNPLGTGEAACKGSRMAQVAEGSARCDRPASRVPPAAGIVKKLQFICLTALPLLMGLAAPAFAQTEARPAGQDAEGAAHAPTSDPLRAESPSTSPARTPRTAAAAPAGEETGTRDVAFAADEVVYEDKSDIVTASGDVRMNSEGNRLKADKVVWNRKTDEARAIGNVRLVTPEGHV